MPNLVIMRLPISLEGLANWFQLPTFNAKAKQARIMPSAPYFSEQNRKQRLLFKPYDLLIAQSDHWIHTHGAPRRNVGSRQSDGNQQNRDTQEG